MKNRSANYRKSGQLQLQETIITIFIIIIIIVIGMSLFFRFQENSIKQETINFKLEQLSNSILTLPDTSEFVYTEDGRKITAIDTTKLLALKALTVKKQEYYQKKLGYKTITVTQVYPQPANQQECTEGTQGNCGKWTVYNKIPDKYKNIQQTDIPKFIKETPTSLYNPITGEHTIGILKVEEYQI